MQRLHPGKGPPQRHAGPDKALTEAIKQDSGIRAAQSLADRPDVQFDDFLPERAVEAQREQRYPRRVRRIEHQRWVYRNLPPMHNDIVGVAYSAPARMAARHEIAQFAVVTPMRNLLLG